MKMSSNRLSSWRGAEAQANRRLKEAAVEVTLATSPLLKAIHSDTAMITQQRYRLLFTPSDGRMDIGWY